MMKNIFTIILFLLLSFPLRAYVQTDVFRGLSVSDGLSDLLVNAIYKDSAGYVWLGTGNSLDRFDGVHVRHYPIAGGNEQLKRVNALAEMPSGRLWMGNGAGLWRLNRESGALEQVVPETIGCAVNCLLSLRGVLYVGTERGLFIYDQGTFEQVLLDGNVFAAANAVMAICEGTKGRLWLATRRGLYALYLSDHSIVAYHNVLSDKHLCSFRNMTRIGDMLYLGTMEQGIVRFDTRTGQFTPYVNVGCNVISSLSSDGKSQLYVGTDGNGVHFVDVDSGEIVCSMRHEAGNDASLRSNSVYSLLVDRDGIIWVGFYQFGLNYTLYQNGLFSVYAWPPRFDSKDMPIRAIAINGSEKLIGSRDGLFYIDERRGIFKSFRAPQLRSDMVFCILFHEGEYYVGTYGGGMYVFNPQTLSLRDFDDTLQMPFHKGHIFCLREDTSRRLWVGTSAGLYCYKDGALQAHYTSGNSKLPDGNVYEIYFDSTGKGWICTENGMCIWDPSSSSLRTDIFPEGFVHKEKIRVVYEDSAHTLYFFPDKGALFVSDLTMNVFHRLQPGTPLEGRDGLFIIEDAAGWLWMGTSDGLFRYDKQDNFVPYNFVDGIPSSIFTLCPPVLDGSGRLWLGNSKGLVYMDVADVDRREENLPPVRVTDVHVNGKSSPLPAEEQADGSRKLSLNSSQKNVTFCFSDFTYTAPAYMSYEYKLEGKDENWVAVTGRSDVTYYNLPSGSYLFKVRRMGEPSSEDRLTVSIAPPFMLWAVLGFALVAFVGGVSYLVRRKREAGAAGRNSRTETLPQPQPLPLPQPVEAEVPKSLPAEEKYKSIKVDADECRRMLERLDELMRTEKLYTNPELKIADLAATLHTTTHLLSYLFNHHLNRNYYDFLNDYRIEEFKRLVASEEYAKYTLAALAELCGFSSRASFFRYFKKATGITPNEYIRNLGAPNE